MEHLRMKLHSPHWLRGRGKGCVSHIMCRTNHLKALGDGGDGVAVTHPDLRTSVEAFEERIVEVDGLKVGTPVLAAVGLLDAAAQRV